MVTLTAYLEKAHTKNRQFFPGPGRGHTTIFARGGSGANLLPFFLDLPTGYPMFRR